MTAVGKKARRSTSQNRVGKSTNVGMSLCPSITTILGPFSWTTSRWLERGIAGAMWTILGKVDLEDPDPLLNQVSVGCTQRGAYVDHHVGRLTTIDATSWHHNCRAGSRQEEGKMKHPLQREHGDPASCPRSSSRKPTSLSSSPS